MPRLREGFAKSGGERAQFEITGGGFIATGADDAAVAKMFEWVRQRVAFYGSTPGYWPVLDLHGLGDLGRELNALSKQGRWEDMTRSIVVHLFAAVGTHRDLAAAIERRFGGISDAVNVGAGVPSDVLQDVRRIPATFGGYRPRW
ncbi:MAG: LLM class flavin-dependent oxidoreductase [Acetobacteraceae bacterium]